VSRASVGRNNLNNEEEEKKLDVSFMLKFFGKLLVNDNNIEMLIEENTINIAISNWEHNLKPCARFLYKLVRNNNTRDHVFVKLVTYSNFESILNNIEKKNARIFLLTLKFYGFS